MSPRAVLLDFDGVIADTENIHVVAWERTFAALGWDVPPEVCARAAEEDDRLFLASVFAGRGIDDGDIDGWVRRKQGLTVGMLADAPRVYPGLIGLIGRLADRARLAIVSGTWRENVEIVLKAAGLAERFELIVAKEEVATPKPDPEPYRHALGRLGLGPDQAMALEDSPSGLESARGAGLRCIAVGHRRPAGAWTGDAPYLADLTDADRVLMMLGWRFG